MLEAIRNFFAKICSLRRTHVDTAVEAQYDNGGNALSRRPFGDTADLEALAPAPLPNPGLPRHLGALLGSEDLETKLKQHQADVTAGGTATDAAYEQVKEQAADASARADLPKTRQRKQKR